MISSGDYDSLAAGDSLPVLDNTSLDDMMAADYSLGYSNLIFMATMWMVILYILFRQNKSK